MPTNILLSIEQRRVAQKKDASNVRAYILLIPVIACLGTIVLAIKYPAVAIAVIALGEE